MTGWIVLGVVVVLVLWAVGIYNGLIRKRVQVDNGWSQIDVQLKRRYDLIPNLVETVKGYAKHERETLEKVIQARQAGMNAMASGNVAGVAAAENMLSGALKSIFALSEAYPDLKANQNFAQLQEEIASTENRVAFSRQHYNDSVAAFNAAIEQVPANFIASFGNFKARDFFELDAAEAQAVKQAPRVSF